MCPSSRGPSVEQELLQLTSARRRARTSTFSGSLRDGDQPLREVLVSVPEASSSTTDTPPQTQRRSRRWKEERRAGGAPALVVLVVHRRRRCRHRFLCFCGSHGDSFAFSAERERTSSFSLNVTLSPTRPRSCDWTPRGKVAGSDRKFSAGVWCKASLKV